MHPAIYRKLTLREQSVLHRVKCLACFVGIALGLCGCSSVQISPGWAIMNNTGFILMVYQDGKLAHKLPPGTVTRITHSLFLYNDYCLVNVAAYDSGGGYHGAKSYTFCKFAPYNWQINNVEEQRVTP